MIYTIAAILGLVILVTQLVLGFMEFELHDDVSSDSAFDLLSLRAIAAGTAMFGFAGKLSESLLVALVLGGTVYLAVAWLSHHMKSLDSNGAPDFYAAIGTTGRVYSSITPTQPGKIQLAIQGEVLDAPARSTEPLALGTTVAIIDFDGAMYTVQPLQKGS
jgi:membrane protein implicated in regulation of membrane protease activity